MTISEAIDQVLKNRMKNRANATAEKHTNNRKYLLDWFTNRPVSDFEGPMGYRLLQGYVDHMEGEDYASTTIVCRLRTLQMALKEAIREGALVAMPPAPHIEHNHEPRKVWLTRAEYAAVRLKIEDLNRRRWFDLAIWTGQHSSDVERMTRADIKNVHGQLYFTRRNTKNRVPELLCAATPQLAEILRAIPRETIGPLVAPWPTAWRDLKIAAAAAGVNKPLAPIDCRRTCATWWAEGGGDRDALRLFLGHSRDSRMVEEVYLQVTPRMLSNGIGALAGIP